MSTSATSTVATTNAAGAAEAAEAATAEISVNRLSTDTSSGARARTAMDLGLI